MLLTIHQCIGQPPSGHLIQPDMPKAQRLRNPLISAKAKKPSYNCSHCKEKKKKRKKVKEPAEHDSDC